MTAQLTRLSGCRSIPVDRAENRVTVRCVHSREEGAHSKSSRECINRKELDMETLVWTRGRAFLSRASKAAYVVRVAGRATSLSFTSLRPTLPTGGASTMCNLYSLTKGQAAIVALVRAMRDRTGNLPSMPGSSQTIQRRSRALRPMACVSWRWHAGACPARRPSAELR